MTKYRSKPSKFKPRHVNDREHFTTHTVTLYCPICSKPRAIEVPRKLTPVERIAFFRGFTTSFPCPDCGHGGPKVTE